MQNWFCDSTTVATAFVSLYSDLAILGTPMRMSCLTACKGTHTTHRLYHQQQQAQCPGGCLGMESIHHRSKESLQVSPVGPITSPLTYVITALVIAVVCTHPAVVKNVQGDAIGWPYFNAMQCMFGM